MYIRTGFERLEVANPPHHVLLAANRTNSHERVRFKYTRRAGMVRQMLEDGWLAAAVATSWREKRTSISSVPCTSMYGTFAMCRALRCSLALTKSLKQMSLDQRTVPAAVGGVIMKESLMKTRLVALALLLVAAVPAYAGKYGIAHGQDCPALRAQQVFNIINQVGIEERLDLPEDQRIAGSIRCGRHASLTEQDGNPVYMYTWRVAIERRIRDGTTVYWVQLRPNLENVSYGLATADLLDRSIRDSTRRLIRLLK